METNILGKDSDAIGIEVHDSEGVRHIVNVKWNGGIEKHTVDEGTYPHDPADRTDEQQLIMSRIEARALYAAHQEFPEEGLVDPQWDPDHLERGLVAFEEYPLDAFREEFRDYFEAIQQPESLVPHEGVPEDSWRIHKSFTITDENTIDDISEVFVAYRTPSGEGTTHGQIPQFEPERTITLGLPKMDIDDDVDYAEEFPTIVDQHLRAQIRDVYFHMGEKPPEGVRVQGFGKFNFYGDGETEWINVTDADGKPVKPELCDA